MSAGPNAGGAVLLPPAAARGDRSWTVLLAGGVLLTLRLAYASGPGGRWLLASAYLAVGTAAAFGAAREVAPASTAAAAPMRGRSASAVALGVGLGAFALVAAVDRPAIHASAGAVGMGLSAMAAVAEEAFFRGLLYGRLARFGSSIAVAGSGAAFALIHMGTYPTPAVWVALAAGLLFGWQRWATGSWMVPAATHVAANLLAVTV
jgi:membrane protease YdiL (CAAX protease family)